MNDTLKVFGKLHSLLNASENLMRSQSHLDTATFNELVTKFEHEVDKLNTTLHQEFGDDVDVIQMTYELKAAAIALRGSNVETTTAIVETNLNIDK